MTGTPQHGEAPLSVVSKHGFVKAAVEQGLSEVESPPKAAAKRPPKRLHFYRYIHIESDNVILCAVLVKLRRRMAAVAVKDKETIDSARTRRCMSIKVPFPLNAKLICCPAIV
jgi:hypothetical protein